MFIERNNIGQVDFNGVLKSKGKEGFSLLVKNEFRDSESEINRHTTAFVILQARVPSVELEFVMGKEHAMALASLILAAIEDIERNQDLDLDLD